MAISTEGSKENTSDSTEVNSDGNADVEHLEFEDIPDLLESDRTEEVPALLGGSVSSESEEPDIVTDQDSVEEDAVPADDVSADDETDKDASAPDSFRDLPDNQLAPANIAVPEISATEHSAVGFDVKNILESLQDSLSDTKHISSKIDEVSNDTVGLIKQVNGISLNCELLAAEMESISSDSNTKGILSKAFLTISSVIIVLLAIFQIYMFSSLVKTQRIQNAMGPSVLDNISNLNKKMAEYDKKLTKVLENAAQQEHAAQTPVAAEKTRHETSGNNEVDTAHVSPVLEKLNKLRNGLPEKKLIRKETGDWFVYNKKSNECISDIEVIEALNQAYKKIGKTISTSIPLPSHNALCILKPDGKGGTQVVMTKNFVP